jgi:hypothetical protein
LQSLVLLLQLCNGLLQALIVLLQLGYALPQALDLQQLVVQPRYPSTSGSADEPVTQLLPYRLRIK